MAVSGRWPSSSCCLRLLFLALLATALLHAAAAATRDARTPPLEGSCPTDLAACMGGKANRKCCDAVNRANGRSTFGDVCMCLQRYSNNACCVTQKCLNKSCKGCKGCNSPAGEEGLQVS